jgi:hypothetical protein
MNFWVSVIWIRTTLINMKCFVPWKKALGPDAPVNLTPKNSMLIVIPLPKRFSYHYSSFIRLPLWFFQAANELILRDCHIGARSKHGSISPNFVSESVWAASTYISSWSGMLQSHQWAHSPGSSEMQHSSSAICYHIRSGTIHWQIGAYRFILKEELICISSAAIRSGYCLKRMIVSQGLFSCATHNIYCASRKWFTSWRGRRCCCEGEMGAVVVALCYICSWWLM